MKDDENDVMGEGQQKQQVSFRAIFEQGRSTRHLWNTRCLFTKELNLFHGHDKTLSLHALSTTYYHKPRLNPSGTAHCPFWKISFPSLESTCQVDPESMNELKSKMRCESAFERKRVSWLSDILFTCILFCGEKNNFF